MQNYIDRRSEPGVKLNFKESGLVSAAERTELNGHRTATFWLTGLSGAGKSTITRKVERKLWERGYQVCVLDGDNMRLGLNSDLGFSPADRHENIRRASEVARLMNNAGMIVLAAFISPYASDRETAAKIIGSSFQEVFVDADVDTCRERDPKGLYARFAAGELRGFTGLDAPYERPENADLRLNTSVENEACSVNRLYEFVLERLALNTQPPH